MSPFQSPSTSPNKFTVISPLKSITNEEDDNVFTTPPKSAVRIYQTSARSTGNKLAPSGKITSPQSITLQPPQNNPTSPQSNMTIILKSPPQTITSPRNVNIISTTPMNSVKFVGDGQNNISVIPNNGENSIFAYTAIDTNSWLNNPLYDSQANEMDSKSNGLTESKANNMAEINGVIDSTVNNMVERNGVHESTVNNMVEKNNDDDDQIHKVGITNKRTEMFEQRSHPPPFASGKVRITRTSSERIKNWQNRIDNAQQEFLRPRTPSVPKIFPTQSTLQKSFPVFEKCNSESNGVDMKILEVNNNTEVPCLNGTDDNEYQGIKSSHCTIQLNEHYKMSAPDDTLIKPSKLRESLRKKEKQRPSILSQDDSSESRREHKRRRFIRIKRSGRYQSDLGPVATFWQELEKGNVYGDCGQKTKNVDNGDSPSVPVYTKMIHEDDGGSQEMTKMSVDTLILGKCYGGTQ